MIMAMLDDLLDHLAAEGVGVVGTDLWASVILESDEQPDEVTVLFESPGLPDQDTMGDDTQPAFASYGVQVRTRAGAWDYETARARAVAAKRALLKIANEDINGSRYFRVSHESGPFPLERDRQERPHFVVNLLVTRVAE